MSHFQQPAREETVLLPAGRKVRLWPFAVSGLVIFLLYAINVIYCQKSTLQFFDAFFPDGDMRANLLWAKGIREQGWLNPVPYHPWNPWMQSMAPYAQWLKWWRGGEIFQQSPLYAYLLSLFVHRYFLMRILQALMSIATCVFIGLFSARMAGRVAGWIAFWLAALYAPFYLYSWPFLRDGLSWFISAALLWVLSELTQLEWSSGRARLFAWLVGILLGLGFLARETYSLLIPIVWVALSGFAWKRRYWGIVPRVVIATVFTIFPLLVRNWLVKAPLLSTSNRFTETFVTGNAGTATPYGFLFPKETGRILYETNAQTLPLIRATIASHPDGVRGWLRLQLLKLVAALDPFELADNVSFYFVAHVSPVVRLGLRYWMILPVGLVGLFLGIWRREQAHLWIWLFLPIFVATLFLGLPLSRYRQSLMIFFIPSAAYMLVYLWALIARHQYRHACYYAVTLLAGWALLLGPLSREPRESYERPVEYLVSAEIYHRLGDDRKAQEIRAFVRQRFPRAVP